MTLRVSDSSSVHHQEFFTVHTAMVYVAYTFADSLRPLKLHAIYQWCVYSEKLMMMDGEFVRII